MSINDNDMETNLDDIVTAIYWSSGTTEHPRGIPHKHRTKLILLTIHQFYNFKKIWSHYKHQRIQWPSSEMLHDQLLLMPIAQPYKFCKRFMTGLPPVRAIVKSFHLTQIASSTDSSDTSLSRRLSVQSCRRLLWCEGQGPGPIKY